MRTQITFYKIPAYEVEKAPKESISQENAIPLLFVSKMLRAANELGLEGKRFEEFSVAWDTQGGGFYVNYHWVPEISKRLSEVREKLLGFFTAFFKLFGTTKSVVRRISSKLLRTPRI